MPTADRAIDRATRRARQFLDALGDEIRRGRIEIGVSQATLGRSVGISQSHISRTEAGRNQGLTLVLAAQLLAGVGRDLSAKVYRGASPMRDAAQLRLLDRLRQRIPDGLRFRTEVPLGLPEDQRAWDAVADGAGLAVAFECYSRLQDAQATERNLNLKQRDSAVPTVVLVLLESRHNREAIAAAGGLRKAFPLTGRAVFGALRAGTQPRANGLVLL